MHTFSPVRLRLHALAPTQAPRSLTDLLVTLPVSELVSVWSGPDFSEHRQPTLVGVGAAVALIVAPAPPPQVWVDESLATTVLYHPSREDVLGLLSARDHLPGDQVRHQPQFSRLWRCWQELVKHLQLDTDATTAAAFAQTDISWPAAFVSFGFGPHVPAVAILPRRTWIHWEQQWFVLDAEVEGVPAPADTAAVSWQESPDASVELTPGTMRRSQWQRAVAEVIAEIRAGNAQKVVMSRDLRVHAPQGFPVGQLASSLAQKNPTCWVFAVAGLVGASPEMLASVRGPQVRSRVLAGTCPAGAGSQLLQSTKDREEHALAVASVTGALESMTRQLQASAEPFLLELPHVCHLATEVHGQLESYRSLCDVLAGLHPSAAVCGTPTQAAFEILAAFERTDRGRYSGPVGWMDTRGSGACAIALRCGQLDSAGTSIRLFAGGGIMPTSDPDAELEETQAKMAAMLESLGIS